MQFNLDLIGRVRDPWTTSYSDITSSTMQTCWEESNGSWSFIFSSTVTDSEIKRIKLRLITTPAEEQKYLYAYQLIQQLTNTSNFVGTATPQQLTDAVKTNSAVLAQLIPLILTKFDGLL